MAAGVDFEKRYIRWLIGPPLAVFTPISFWFLYSVEQLNNREWGLIGFCWVALAATVTLVFRSGIQRQLDAARVSLDTGHGIAESLSLCLSRTWIAAIAGWVSGVVVFSLLSTILVNQSTLSIRHFFVAALLICAPSMTWSSIGAKPLLIEAAAGHPDLRYVGRRLSIATKVAILFIGLSILSAAALVQLVSTKVSMTLERLAIDSSKERFERIYDTANLSSTIDADMISNLRHSVPLDHRVVLITDDGRMVGPEGALTPAEAAIMLSRKEGDSTQFVSQHVSIFRVLKDDSILVMTIPWQPYARIPSQIAKLTVIVTAVTTLFFIVSTVFLSRDINGSLRRLIRAAAEMAEGNFLRSPKIFSDDEIGQLTESFSETRSNLRRLLGTVAQQGSSVTEGVRVIGTGTENLIARAREQTEQTNRSTKALESMRQGSGSILSAAEAMSGLVHDSSSKSLELQASSEEVAKSMDSLFESVERTSSSAVEMEASSSEMARRAEVLSDIGEEVLSFVAEMQSTSEELRQGATRTAEISREVKEDAAAGSAAVDRTVEGIHLTERETERTSTLLAQLQKSVMQISQIVLVIEEIANKTNLLSLNAAIIAAQAGEHGVGFTVVAEEIRELADRTRGSTREIRGIVKDIQTKTGEATRAMEDGVSRVRETVETAHVATESLSKILSSADRSYEMAGRIAGSLGEQADASHHLHEVTSRMADHIGEISRSTREQARGSRLLAVEAETVRDIALGVKESTRNQTLAGRGITAAMERFDTDARAMRDLLENQVSAADRIADASQTMLGIAKANEELARSFSEATRALMSTGRDFETEVRRFQFTESK